MGTFVLHFTSITYITESAKESFIRNMVVLLRNLVRIHVLMTVDPKDTGQSRRARGHEERAPSTRCSQRKPMMRLPLVDRASSRRERAARLSRPREGSPSANRHGEGRAMQRRLRESSIRMLSSYRPNRIGEQPLGLRRDARILMTCVCR
jgi:hypothetical protein